MSDKTRAGMSRRKLLEAAGSAAAAVAAAGLTGPTGAVTPPQNEAEIIDDRLTRKVTLAVKPTALADLCERLRADTGVAITGGPSVADEKVTVFCREAPLRDVMRQLSRPFGYTWLRSGKSGVYRYELVQDLRSQLLEEELRNRDRSAAFLALEREIQRYRPYLDLSPDEALARAKTAPAEEKPLLEALGRSGWGAIQMYFRLTGGAARWNSAAPVATTTASRKCPTASFLAGPRHGGSTDSSRWTTCARSCSSRTPN